MVGRERIHCIKRQLLSNSRVTRRRTKCLPRLFSSSRGCRWLLPVASCCRCWGHGGKLFACSAIGEQPAGQDKEATGSDSNFSKGKTFMHELQLKFYRFFYVTLASSEWREYFSRQIRERRKRSAWTKIQEPFNSTSTTAHQHINHRHHNHNHYDRQTTTVIIIATTVLARRVGQGPGRLGGLAVGVVVVPILQILCNKIII